MSDRRARLQALAQKRRNDDTAPSHSNKKSKLSSERTSSSKPTINKKTSAPKKRVTKDKFVVDSEDEEEEDEDDEDDEDEESEPEYSEDENPRKRGSSSSKKDKMPVKKPAKKLASKKGKEDEDEGFGGEDDKSDISDNELEGLDTSVIIPGGRRTRGRKIDYKQFGADPEGEDE